MYYQKRDKSIYKRCELRCWKGDTVESGRIDRKKKSKYCFVTLSERKSRKYIAILVPTRTATDVTPAIINVLKEYPDDLVKTMTFDRGKDLPLVDENELKINLDKMNNRPRKCLGFKTPNAVFGL